MSLLPDHPLPIYSPLGIPSLPTTSAGPKTNAVSWTLVAISLIFLSLRFYCKRGISRVDLWWDDRILLASWLLFFLSSILLSLTISWGYGQHPWLTDFNSSSPRDTAVMMARSTLAVTAAAWSKTAFAVTILRIAEGPGSYIRYTKWGIWAVILSLNVVLAMNGMMAWVGCNPVQKAWDWEWEGECFDTGILVGMRYAAGAWLAVCSFILALLPWPIIWKLHMKRKEKIGVGVGMSMGFVAGIMATVKTAALHKLSTGDSYDAAHVTMLETAEIAITIMAASIPAMRVLFREFASSVKRGRYWSYQEPGGKGGAIYGTNRTGAVVTVKGGEHVEVVNGGDAKSDKDDNKSDRGILRAADRIYRVDEVEVTSTYDGVGVDDGKDETGADLEGAYQLREWNCSR
ncbi:hypothetical protein QBC35DRAFT_437492 [Podospora australis]|uniref:Rhodopsin domain-containing protein n=1 Tax=Podospora australis TaxID=1536484 RepID=A0AAN6WU68_9PEZI|nr:hypothetical protein QBC35DRAFT_437492 [Podospora australis]